MPSGAGTPLPAEAGRREAARRWACGGRAGRPGCPAPLGRTASPPGAGRAPRQAQRRALPGGGGRVLPWWGRLRTALAGVLLFSPALSSPPAPLYFLTAPGLFSLSLGRLLEKRAVPFARLRSLCGCDSSSRNAGGGEPFLTGCWRHMQGTALWFSNSEIFIHSSGDVQ